LEKEWVNIFTCSQQYKAELIKAMLENHNINSIIVNKKDSLYLIGDIEIYVNVEDAFDAKQLILKQQSE